MRNLKLQLNLKSEGTSAGGMSEFQLYILREREAYIKSLNDVSTSFPMYNDNLNSHHKSFNLGSLQNSAYGGPTGRDMSKKKENFGGLLNSNIGKQSTSSQGSLQYVSKNLSNSPMDDNNNY